MTGTYRNRNRASIEGIASVDDQKSTPGGELDYLQLSRKAYESSTDYMSSNLRRQWERNISNFRSRHPPGSKYRTDQYKHRSRLFRPKSRSTVRKNEAAMTLAFFSTSDAANIKAVDGSNQEHVDSAKVMGALVEYRLDKSIKWFITSVAAYQEAQVVGIIVSKQYWAYEEQEVDVETTTEIINSLGVKIGEEVEKTTEMEAVEDRPVIELIEPENFRMDPGADWADPINSSPYLIHLIPMYVGDIMDRMEAGANEKTGQPAWKKMSLQQIIAALSDQTSDSTRLAREGNRQDPKDDNYSDIHEHSIVWVHENIVRIPGQGDVHYYTLGVYEMLSDPVPLEEVYLHGRRPFSMGVSVIEAHRNYPSSIIELGQEMQAATNDNMNQRFDNVRQALNKRFFVRRGATVDLRSLRRNVPGGTTLMSDVDRDVKVQEMKDVTGSSYNEQDRFTQDYDEVTGSFSPNSVTSGQNKKLMETVGGSQMMKGSSNEMVEYSIRVFAETWVKETLEQLVALEQAYETDETIIALAGRNAKVDKIPDVLMEARLGVNIGVGFGVTDPEKRIGKIMYGLKTISEAAPGMMQRLKEEEIANEVMGILGYKDGARFFMTAEELQEKQQGAPERPSIEMLELQQEKELAVMKMEQLDVHKAAEIESAERMLQAKLSLEAEIKGKTPEEAADLIARYDLDVEKEITNRMKVVYQREDSLRKDAEIKDKETAKTARE